MYTNADALKYSWFQWNTLIPGTETTNHYDWDPATDPCTKYSNRWRVPSREEAEVACYGETVYGTPGNSSFFNNAPVYGMWFGTDTAPTDVAEQSEYLFLPLAGYSDPYHNVYKNPGDMGHYRTSEGYGSNLMEIMIQKSGSLLIGASSNNQSCYDSVRCVSDSAQ
jgi:hypothetical protein